MPHTRATFNRGHRDIAKFAVYREICCLVLRNLLLTTTNSEKVTFTAANREFMIHHDKS